MDVLGKIRNTTKVLHSKHKIQWVQYRLEINSQEIKSYAINLVPIKYVHIMKFYFISPLIISKSSFMTK